MNNTLTHYGEGLVGIITDRYTVWDYVDEGTSYGEFEGTKAECEDFVANAQSILYNRLEISESGYDTDGGLMGIYPALRDGNTRNGVGCVGAVGAYFNEGLAEDFYPSRAMVASMERHRAKEAEAKKRLAFESYGIR